MRKKPSNFPKHYLCRYYTLQSTTNFLYKNDKTFEFGMELSNFWTIFMTFPTLKIKNDSTYI